MTFKTTKLPEWLESDIPLTLDMFEAMKGQVRSVTPSEQMLFLKKVINEIAKGNIRLTVKDLTSIKSFSLQEFQEFGHPAEVDYNLHLILHTLNLLDESDNFSGDRNYVKKVVGRLADIICDYLQDNVDYLRKIDLLFDDCPGRTAIVRKRPFDFYVTLKGNDYKVYKMYQGYSKTEKGSVIFHYQDGIYAKGQKCMLEVIDRQPQKRGDFSIKYGKNISYNGNLYSFVWKIDDNPYLITPDSSPVKFCEGKKSEKACDLSGKEFWWCRGRKCFKPNQQDRSIYDWKQYTLRDFLRILNISFDEEDYYTFVGEVNRINQLIERIKCTECKAILRPSRQGNFGFYRIAHFQCNVSNCSCYQKEVNLTHCLNSKCLNVVDDRVAKRCENGFIICDKCGSCCSNEQFIRRKGNLEDNGQPIPNQLLERIRNRSGHWEKAECYCYKCQKELIEEGGEFSCKPCGVSYGRQNTYIRSFKDFKTLNEIKKKKRNQFALVESSITNKYKQ